MHGDQEATLDMDSHTNQGKVDIPILIKISSQRFSYFHGQSPKTCRPIDSRRRKSKNSHSKATYQVETASDSAHKGAAYNPPRHRPYPCHQR